MVKKTQRSYIVLIYVMFWIFYKSELWQPKLAPRRGYWLDNRWIVFPFRAGTTHCYRTKNAHTCCGALPTCSSMGTKGKTPGMWRYPLACI